MTPGKRHPNSVRMREEGSKGGIREDRQDGGYLTDPTITAGRDGEKTFHRRHSAPITAEERES